MDRTTLRPVHSLESREPFRPYYHPGLRPPSCSRRGVVSPSSPIRPACFFIGSNVATTVWKLSLKRCLWHSNNSPPGTGGVERSDGVVDGSNNSPHHSFIGIKENHFDLITNPAFGHPSWFSCRTFTGPPAFSLKRLCPSFPMRTPARSVRSDHSW